MKKSITLLTFMALLCGSGFAKDLKTVIFTTQPQMHCASCENKIKQNLRFEKGVKQIETVLDSQLVKVKYDASKTNEQKLIKGFKKIGYTARTVKPGVKVAKQEGQVCSNM